MILARLAPIVLLAAACGESSSPPASSSSAENAPKTTDAPRSKAPKGPRGPIDPAQVGRITGVVRFDGEAPARKELSIGGTAGCPEHPTPVFEESVIVADKKLANVFVHVKDGHEGWDVPPLVPNRRTMDQNGCLYVPHVLGMRAGETLSISNSDAKTTHNVNVRSRNNDAINPVQPPGGQPIEWTPKKREVAVSFECNLHPWMKAWVCVVDHPWFAVTGADGSFEIQGLPPGDYVLEAWHEKFGKKTANVTLAPSGSAEATFAFKPGDKPR